MGASRKLRQVVRTRTGCTSSGCMPKDGCEFAKCEKCDGEFNDALYKKRISLNKGEPMSVDERYDTIRKHFEKIHKHDKALEEIHNVIENYDKLTQERIKNYMEKLHGAIDSITMNGGQSDVKEKYKLTMRELRKLVGDDFAKQLQNFHKIRGMTVVERLDAKWLDAIHEAITTYNVSRLECATRRLRGWVGAAVLKRLLNKPFAYGKNKNPISTTARLRKTIRFNRLIPHGPEAPDSKFESMLAILKKAGANT